MQNKILYVCMRILRLRVNYLKFPSEFKKIIPNIKLKDDDLTNEGRSFLTQFYKQQLTPSPKHQSFFERPELFVTQIGNGMITPSNFKRTEN